MRTLLLGICFVTVTLIGYGVSNQSFAQVPFPQRPPKEKKFVEGCEAAQQRLGEAVYYNNGQLLTESPGVPGVPWYYPDGSLMTAHAGYPGAVWYHPNGRVLTYSANPGQPYYYSNGSLISIGFGLLRSRYYYPTGMLMLEEAPQLSESDILYPCFWLGL